MDWKAKLEDILGGFVDRRDMKREALMVVDGMIAELDDVKSERDVLAASCQKLVEQAAERDKLAALLPVTDVMIDLETMGNRPGCAIRSIGACAFDPISGATWRHFKVNIDPDSCAQIELHEDPDTRAWWANQSAEAQAALDVDPVQIAKALCLLTEAYPWRQVSRVWCHGASFDDPILNVAYHRALGLKTPWSFSSVRCTRTLYALAGIKPDRSVGVHHDALDDAIAQAKAVAQALKILGRGAA